MTEYLLARRTEVDILKRLVEYFSFLYLFEDGINSASLWMRGERETGEVWKMFHQLRGM